jgi:tRNA-splicing ligase RtcB
MTGTPFEYYGEPVLVPGSMGASSFILAGRGFDGSNQSAAHGAGRAHSRGSSMKGFERDFEDFLQRFRVVTPVDFRRQDIRNRRDIIEKKLAELKQEAPFAYKGIGPVIETIVETGMARPVVELTPLLTVKG